MESQTNLTANLDFLSFSPHRYPFLFFQKLNETIKNDARPHSIVEYGEIMMAEKTLSKEQKLKIEKQLTEIKNEWKSLIAKSAEVKTRLTTIRDESELEEKHKVEEWIRKFERLLKQMTKVKEAIGKLASLPIVNERNRAFQVTATHFQRSCRQGPEKMLTCQVQNKMAGEILQKTKWRPMVGDTIDLQFAIFGWPAVCRDIIPQ